MAVVWHPPLTHYPVALFTIGSLVYLFGKFRKDEGYIDKATFIIFIGLILAIFTGLAGLFDASRAGLTFDISTFLYHVSFAVTTITLYFIGYISHIKGKENFSMIFYSIGFITVLITAYLGGEMVFVYGVNVG